MQRPEEHVRLEQVASNFPNAAPAGHQGAKREDSTGDHAGFTPNGITVFTPNGITVPWCQHPPHPAFVDGGLLVALFPALGIPNLDGTMVIVALPTIGRDLGASISDLQWITVMFALGNATLLPLSASLGDLYGRRRTMLVGYWLYLAGTIAAALSPSVGLLLGARAVQGFGMALLFSNALAKIGVVFDERERGRAVGIWIGLSAGALIAGPLMAGWLVEHLAWPAIFWVTAFFTVIGAVGLVRFVPDDGVRRRANIDYPGMATSTMALFFLAFGFVEAGRRGVTAPIVVLSVVIGLLSVAVFVLVERRSDHPMVDPALFTDSSFGTVLRIGVCVNTAVTGVFFLITLYLQSLLSMSPWTAAVILAIMFVPMIFSPYVAGAVGDRLGFKRPLVAGMGFTAVTLAWLGLVATSEASVATIVPPLALFGLGLGWHFSIESTAIVSSVPPTFASAGTASLSAVRQVGASFSVALFGTFATFATQLRSRAALEPLGYDTSNVRFAGFDPAMAREVEGVVRSASGDAFGDLMLLAAILFGLGSFVGLPLIRGR